MELYHVLNRGVERRTLFVDTMDHARFVHDMYEFNDVEPANNAYRIFYSQKSGMMDLRGPSFDQKRVRERIVDIHGWCLMKNHYHLLLSERRGGGLTKFIMRLNVGYAKYFNQKYDRSGYVFEGRTKKILVGNDAHFLHILHYIHLNPLDFSKESRDWREGRVKSAREALANLENYRWSSFLDYCGKKNFSSILTTDLFQGTIGNIKKSTTRFLEDREIRLLGDTKLELE